MLLRIHRLRQLVSPNTQGVASSSPGLPFTATPGSKSIQIKNSNGVPAWVGRCLELGIDHPDTRAETTLWFKTLNQASRGRRSFLTPTPGWRTQHRWC